jgi:hypothetical protein
LGISSIPQTFPDLRLSNTDLMLYKVYAKIIEQSVMSYMEDNGILGEMQGAFRRKDGRRTTFLLYKGYVHLENQKRIRYSSPF